MWEAPFISDSSGRIVLMGFAMVRRVIMALARGNRVLKVRCLREERHTRHRLSARSPGSRVGTAMNVPFNGDTRQTIHSIEQSPRTESGEEDDEGESWSRSRDRGPGTRGL